MDVINSLRPRPNRRHFADDIFKCIFENENEWISPRISLKFVPEVRINNIPALVQIMAWRRPGDKPLSEPMMVSLLTHICVTRPQWVNSPCLDLSLTLLVKWTSWMFNIYIYNIPRLKKLVNIYIYHILTYMHLGFFLSKWNYSDNIYETHMNYCLYNLS